MQPCSMQYSLRLTLAEVLCPILGSVEDAQYADMAEATLRRLSAAAFTSSRRGQSQARGSGIFTTRAPAAARASGMQKTSATRSQFEGARARISLKEHPSHRNC